MSRRKPGQCCGTATTLFLVVGGFFCLWIPSRIPAAPVLPKDEKRQAERALRTGDLDQAERLFRELVIKNDHDLRARLGLSQTLLKKRKLKEAREHASFVLARDTHSARARSIIGTAFMIAGDFRGATEYLEAALQVDDRDSLATAGLASIDFYENRLEESLRGLRRAVQLDSSEPDFVFLLAQTAARLERFGEAADAYAKFLAISLNSDSDRRERIKGLIDFLRYLKGQKKLYSIEGPDHSQIPLQLADNLPVLEVRVNGSKDLLRFVLDSGSGMTVISDDTAQRLGVKPVARGGRASAVGGRFGIVYGLLSSLEIGQTRINNVPVYIRRFYQGDNRVDGYLGLLMISKFVTTVDYGARNLTLSLSSSNRSKAAAGEQANAEIPLRITPGGFLSSGVEIGGLRSPLNFIVDTGASISVLSKRLEALDEIRALKTGENLRVFGAAGIEDDVLTRMLPRLKLGSCGRENILAALLNLDAVNETAGFEQAGIVGGNFLRHFRVVFDLRKSIVRLYPLGVNTSCGPLEDRVFNRSNPAVTRLTNPLTDQH